MEDARADARRLLREARTKLMNGSRFTKADMKSVLLKVLEALDNVGETENAALGQHSVNEARPTSVSYVVGVRFDGNSKTTYEYMSSKLVYQGERVFVDSPVSGLTCVTVQWVRPVFGAPSRPFTFKWLIHDVEKFKREQAEMLRERKRLELTNKQAQLSKQLDAVSAELLSL